MINKLVSDSIIITPNGYKEYFLKNIKKLVNIKFMTLEELIKNIIFDYDENTIFYIMNKYNVSYEIALIYIENIYYIDNSYNNEKLTFLCSLKKDLIDNNKVIINNNFKDYIKNKKIFICGYPNYKKIKKIINNIEILEEDEKTSHYEIYEYDDIYNEIIGVGIKILKLLENNISINNIKLMNVSSEYITPLERIFSILNIPINIEKQNNLISIPIINNFLKNLIETKDINKALEYIRNNYNDTENYNLIINKLNDYDCDNIDNIIESLKYYFKNNNKKPIIKSNSINIINNSDYILDSDYVFLMSFNEENIPLIKYDNDFLTDIEKTYLNIDTSIEENNILKLYLIKKLKNINHLIITYKLKTPFNLYKKSSLLSDIPINSNNDDIFNYSTLLNKIELKKEVEQYNKYHIINKNLPLLLSNYQLENNYDNKYKKIDISKLNNYKDSLTLSYSSMENFYECPFKYYINDYLKLTPKKSSFDLEIGSIFHNIISQCFLKKFDFEKIYNESFKNKEWKNSEKFFINKLKKDLLFIINEIKNQLKYSTFDKMMLEEKVYVDIDSEIKLSFVGIIDKIMYKEEDENVYLAIIDYKTGNPNISLNNIKYGLSLQLPIYLYLSKNINKFKSSKVVGIYYQKILDNEIFKKESGKTYLELKKESYKLQGYSIDNENDLEKFDKTFKNSSLIKNMKMTNNGFYAYSKIMNEEKINELITLTLNKIKEAGLLIKNGEFEIKPKIINNKNISCEYCELKDICFKTYNDIEYLKEDKFL